MTIMINLHQRPAMRYVDAYLSQLVLAHLGRQRSGEFSPHRLIRAAAAVGMITSGLLLFSFFAPDIALKVLGVEQKPIEASIDQSALGGMWEDGTLYAESELPPRDENLPDGNWLIIPKTGVRTVIREASLEDHEDQALRYGVWRADDGGTPLEKVNPVILVAHRYGYLKWSDAYRRANSFYNLNKLEIGDTFEVIWDKRRFTYEIYAGEEGEEISDYEADVILYTCKFLNSPARFFRYARRVNW